MAFFGMSPLSEGILPAYQAMEDFILSLTNQARDTLRSGEASNPKSYPTVYTQLGQKLEASKAIPPEQLNTVIAAEMLNHIGALHEGLPVTGTYLMRELAQKSSDYFTSIERITPSEANSVSSQQIDALPLL
ncbi:hypothetical protein DID88_003240 [Monilinia fructigena]|uniref:Uncharacterized protein n=1 Tax=Monilinia fructigena TaxID=38457 RepID=A0A395IUW0_9HELO|nr:hypothetical protein DID88_003240 [Monilinia fructigena]